jgi:hypothetical protein
MGVLKRLSSLRSLAVFHCDDYDHVFITFFLQKGLPKAQKEERVSKTSFACAFKEPKPSAFYAIDAKPSLIVLAASTQSAGSTIHGSSLHC